MGRQVRVAHISDTHVSETRRPQDLVDVFCVFLEQVKSLGVELILYSGDFFDRRSTPRERLVLAGLLADAAHLAPVVGVRGNHDAPEDLQIFNRISPNIQIFERPSAIGEGIEAWLPPPLAVVVLPWFDKAHLVSMVDPTVGPETTRQMTNEAANDLLVGLRAEVDRLRGEGRIPILVSHAMVAGSVTSTGQIMQGVTVELTPFALHEVGAEYVALGHVHKTQEWFGGRVAYAGSPVRQNFGEPEPKGWRLITFEDGSFASNLFMPLPAREMVLLERDWRKPAGREGDYCSPEEIATLAGALVRFRYQIQAADVPLVDEDMLRRWFEGHGVAEIKVEAILEHQARVRAEGITEATSVLDKVLAYFAAKSEPIDEQAGARLSEKLAEIERET